MITLDERSERNLTGVHRDLVAVVRRAAGYSEYEFVVTEGLRTVEKQAQLLKAGASRTMKSRHLTGHAIDLAMKVDGDIRWDWPLYEYISRLMKLASHELGISIIWGGDWPSFRDGPHFELDTIVYA